MRDNDEHFVANRGRHVLVPKLSFSGIFITSVWDISATLHVLYLIASWVGTIPALDSSTGNDSTVYDTSLKVR